MATNKEKQRKNKEKQRFKKKKKKIQEKCFLIKFEDRFEDLEDR